MSIIQRWIEQDLRHPSSQKKVRLLFGARQTGKTTLLRSVIETEAHKIEFDLQDASLRLAFERNPGSFSEQLLAAAPHPRVVFVDEIQKVPALLDEIQRLQDRFSNRFSFVLTGSSARRLRASAANLLPGRSHLFHLFPVVQPERGVKSRILPLVPAHNATFFPPRSLEDLLLFGSLPGISQETSVGATRTVEGYAELYLEDEIRREGLVRDVGSFSRFLEYAALSSGQTLNLVHLSNESGVPKATLRNYYQILVDTFVGYWMEPFIRSDRKRLLSTPRFYFFDLGVRNAAARLAPERSRLAIEGGKLLEHWVGIELLHRARQLGRSYAVEFWRTVGGAEVDFVVTTPSDLIPIEVKWTENPTVSDAKHLLLFMAEYPKAKQAYVVCRVNTPRRIHDRVTAIPWKEL